MSGLSAHPYVDIVSRLRGEYTQQSRYGEIVFSAHAPISFLSNGFMGSANTVFLSAEDFISFQATACVAAPLVTMVAKRAINLGIGGQTDSPAPFRLYAPKQLCITTQHLSIRDVQLVVEPEHGFVSCKRLTLFKSTEEDPVHFEVVKNWLSSDDVEIETIRL